jgi:TrkA domain protein
MGVVRETKLPGVGVRHEFTTHDDTVVGVVQRHDGKSDVVVYDGDDPDVCRSMLHLDADDTHVLARLLGAAEIAQTTGEVQAQIEGLVFEWITLPADAAIAGQTIADGELRTRTGASIVAVLRGHEQFPAPDPSFELAGGDVAVAVGTAEGLGRLRPLLTAT